MVSFSFFDLFQSSDLYPMCDIIDFPIILYYWSHILNLKNLLYDISNFFPQVTFLTQVKTFQCLSLKLKFRVHLSWFLKQNYIICAKHGINNFSLSRLVSWKVGNERWNVKTNTFKAKFWCKPIPIGKSLVSRVIALLVTQL